MFVGDTETGIILYRDTILGHHLTSVSRAAVSCSKAIQSVHFYIQLDFQMAALDASKSTH